MEMVNPMAKHIERAISARSASILIGGRRSGRLHGAGLHKLVMNDERVFCRREQSKTKDVAVSLVVDASGSMRGPKSLTAAQAAFALSSVLERLRIKNEVICFTTGPQVPSYGEINQAQSKGLVYSRITSIVMPVIKEFSEPLNSLVRARFGAMPDQISMESNIDGESIEYAAKRLVRQAASRHVMIVLSDGQPAGATMSRYGNPFGADLKEKVKMIEQAGVDIVGIGIQSRAVQQFYDKSIVINQISELPGAVMGQLQRLLVPQ
jgi:cobalamin biosynthesis protein CobT